MAVAPHRGLVPCRAQMVGSAFDAYAQHSTIQITNTSTTINIPINITYIINTQNTTFRPIQTPRPQTPRPQNPIDTRGGCKHHKLSSCFVCQVQQTREQQHSITTDTNDNDNRDARGGCLPARGYHVRFLGERKNAMVYHMNGVEARICQGQGEPLV